MPEPADPQKPLRIPGETYDPLTRLERVGLVVLLLLVLGFSYLAVRRQALHGNHYTDLSVYCRAAWAVVQNEGIYEVASEKNWHFVYPPAFAIVMTPLQYAPPDDPRQWPLSWPVIAMIWTAIGIGVTAWSVHVLANALERTSSDRGVRDRPRYCRDWWGIRLFAVLFCLPSVMSSLVRGQTDFLLLACFCFMMAAAMRARHWTAGAWLSAAMCLKVIPGLLLVDPLRRRDWKMLGGVALGCAFFLVVLPVVVLGPTEAWHESRRFAEVVLLPGLGMGEDTSRANELIRITATDNQSFKATLHNTLWLNTPREDRPGEAATWVRAAHWGLMLVMLGVTVWAAGRKGMRAAKGLGYALWVSLLIELMLLFSPVTHLHYFMLLIPPVMVLLMWDRERRGRVGISLDVLLLMLGVFIGGLLPRIPGLEVTRDLGLMMWAGVALWVAGIVVLCQRQDEAASIESA